MGWCIILYLSIPHGVPKKKAFHNIKLCPIQLVPYAPWLNDNGQQYHPDSNYTVHVGIVTETHKDRWIENMCLLVCLRVRGERKRERNACLTCMPSSCLCTLPPLSPSLTPFPSLMLYPHSQTYRHINTWPWYSPLPFSQILRHHNHTWLTPESLTPKPGNPKTQPHTNTVLCKHQIHTDKQIREGEWCALNVSPALVFLYTHVHHLIGFTLTHTRTHK